MARWEFEGADARAPKQKIAIHLAVVVLVRVPEGAAVGWVNAHRTVIAPAGAERSRVVWVTVVIL